MKPKISMITLGVTEISRSRSFYRKLGFRLNGDEEEGQIAFFELEGTWLSLYPKEKLAEDAGVANDGRGFSGVTLAHNVSSKSEVDAVINEARNIGAEIVKEPQDVFWGGYSGYFQDPDGYLWEVAWNPYFDLT